MTNMIDYKRTSIVSLMIIVCMVAVYIWLLHSQRGFRTEIYAVESGWGYDIRYDGHRIIRQPFMPAVPGRKPFPSKAMARTAAEMVCRKIECGASPTITLTEIDSLLQIENR